MEEYAGTVEEDGQYIEIMDEELWRYGEKELGSNIGTNQQEVDRC